MRLPRLRFTVRRMMALVAVVAVLLYSGFVVRRWVAYYSLARSHAAQAFGNAIEAGNSYELAYDDVRSGNGEAIARQTALEGDTRRKLAWYHDALGRKYEGA